MSDWDRPAPTLKEQAAYRVRHYRYPDAINWRKGQASDGPDPWIALSSYDVIPWWVAHPEATCSERTARALCWLAQEFGR